MNNAEIDISRYPRSFAITARYGDLDADGLLAETALARYCEQARAHTLETMLGEAGVNLRNGPLGLLIAHMELEVFSHRKPAAEIRLATAVSRIGRTSVQLQVGLYSDGACLATAQNVMVIIDRESGKPVPLPDGLPERLQASMLRP